MGVYCTYILGSMPPHSNHLWEEGMCVKSFYLVKNGVFQEEGKHYSSVCCYLWRFLLYVCRCH